MKEKGFIISINVVERLDNRDLRRYQRMTDYDFLLAITMRDCLQL
ncbi:Uncharacterized protein BM_BM1659 [Brugia malayi]|uniref:Bm1659 n=1 Tax=Brugia malayi TaxID=6279 RepID=A0A1U7F2S3_BRUMA|nr:Uncharacterized protein BM_BM1659 [Brugia malayi]CDQ02995.1 Bm1659 [Brugia malayi]VIO92395.1 Uncharacterized protein BM_BM1659 [Brugia malayi]